MGVDMGVKKRLALSTGETIEPRSVDWMREDELRRRVARSAAGTVDEPGRGVSAKRGLNRSILEQTWGLIRSQLIYKAEWTGRNRNWRIGGARAAPARAAA